MIYRPEVHLKKILHSCYFSTNSGIQPCMQLLKDPVHCQLVMTPSIPIHFIRVAYLAPLPVRNRYDLFPNEKTAKYSGQQLAQLNV